jgi:glycosyltransferase involved in cell wall biosynthesis
LEKYFIRRLWMKVCFVTTSFPRWFGDGQGAFIWEAARSIAEQGAQVCVVAMHSPGAKSHEWMDGIKVLRPRYWWPERWELLRKEGAAGLPATWQKYPLVRLQIVPFIFVQALIIARIARCFDVIHAHWTLSAANACLGRWFHRRPILLTLQGSDVFQVIKHPIGAWLTKMVLSCSNGITALSESLVKAVSSIGFPSNKIHIIPNGVNTSFFVPPTTDCRDNIILYVGSFIERKGINYLLHAMAYVIHKLPQFRLVLIGEGPEGPKLKQLADNLGITEKLVFLGFQPREKVRDWMQRAKLLVLPSIEEAQGVVILEAMACGTPVVASKVGGIPEMVSPEVGVLVPPGDVKALAAAIEGVLRDPYQWSSMSRCARYWVEKHYDWSYIARQYIEIYQSLINRF